MTEPKHFSRLQDQFYRDYSKKIDIQSSLILFTCFHPVASVKGDTLLILEQQFYPQGQKIYDLKIDHSDSRDNESFQSSTVGDLPEKDEKSKIKKKSLLKDESPFIHSKLANLKTGLKEEDEALNGNFTDALQDKVSSSFESSVVGDSIDERSRKVNFADELEEIDNQNFDNQGGIKLTYTNNKLKFKPVEINVAMSKYSKRKAEFRESLKNQIKRMQVLSHRDINQVMDPQLIDEEHYHQILEKQKILEKSLLDIKEKTTVYSIQLWKLNQGKLPVMNTNIDICSDQPFSIYLDQLFYSHDQNFIFFIVISLEGIIEKIVILNSNDLTRPDQHEFDLSKYKIRADEITDNPALIWGHKDSLNLEYMRRSTLNSSTEGYGSGLTLEMPLSQEGNQAPQYQIVGVFFENIKYKGFRNFGNVPQLRKRNDPRMMTLVVKQNHLLDPFSSTLKIYRIGLDQAVNKINEKGFLTFTDEIKFEQTVVHDDFASLNIEIFTSKDCQQILIISENIPEENVLGTNSQGDQEQKKSLILMSSKSTELQKQQKNHANQFLNSQNLKSSFPDQQQIKILDNKDNDSPNQSPRRNDPVLSKNIHLKDDIRILLFNESQQQMVAVTASDIIEKNQQLENNQIVELNGLTQIKFDGNAELQYMNCFDITSDQFGRLLSTGFDLNNKIAKLYFTIYDEENILKNCISKYSCQFINPFIVFSKNNKYLIFASMYDSQWQCQFQLDDCNYLLLYSEFQISCASLTFTQDQLLQMDRGYIDAHHVFFLLLMKQLNFFQDFIYFLEFEINREKVRKCILASVAMPNKQDVIVLIIQYENEILIRPLNSTMFHDQIQTGGSKVPIISQNGQIKGYSGNVMIFIHTIDQNNQNKLNILLLQPNEMPKLELLFDFKLTQILYMQKWDDFLMVLDENLHVKRYKYSHRTGKMRMFRDSELSEESQTMLQFYQSSPDYLVMSDSEVYIGPQFYQSYSNANQAKDTNTLFEQYREKNIAKLDHTTLFMGPILSQDSSMILYISVKECDQDSQEQPIKNKQDVSLQATNQLLNTMDDHNTTENFIQKSNARHKSVNSNLKLLGSGLNSSKNFDFRKSKTTGNKALQAFSDIKDNDPLRDIEIEFRQKKQIENRAIYIVKSEAICIPFLGHKSIQLIHQDDYLFEQVKFSTFTTNDDIFMMMGRQFYAFDGMGNPIKTKICPNDLELLKNPQLEMIRIQKLPNNDQSFLFTDLKKFYLFHLYFQKQCYRFSLSKEIPCLQPQSIRDVFHEGKQDQLGRIYQLLIEPDIENANGPADLASLIQIQVDGDKLDYLEQKFNKLLFKNQENVNQEAVKANLNENVEKSYQNVSNTEEDKDQSDLKAVYENASMRYDFELLHEKYFVLKSQTEIYFYNLTQNNNSSKPIQKVNLILRPGVITQILQTQKEDLLQFVYTQYCPTKATYIFTWNLESNMEDSKIIFPQTVQKPVNISITKGVSERLNYYIPSKESCIYDLRYNFPLNYFDGISACLKLHMSHLEEKSRKELYINKRTSQFKIRSSKTAQLNELKFSSFNLKMLGQSKQQFATLYLTYSFMDLQYLEFLFQSFETQKVKDDGTDIKYLLMRYLKFRLPNGNNILHLTATREIFLQIYQKDVEFLMNDLDFKEAEQFYFLSIYPNNDGVSPLEIAIHEFHPRSVEMMLDMISSRPKYNYSRYIQKHFYKLLEMKSESFSKFLDICTFKIERFFKCSWNYQKDQRQFSHHTSYIEDRFLKVQFKVDQEYVNDLYSQILQDKNNSNNQAQSLKTEILYNKYTSKQQDNWTNKFEGFEYDIDSLEYCQQNDEDETQSIIFTAIEFPWIFRGKSAINFIEYLTKAEDNTNIFQIPTIQDIIIFQWRHFKKSYMKYKMLPFSIYFILILIYCTVNFDDFSNDDQNVNDQYSSVWNQGHIVIGSILLVFALYFTMLEIFRIRMQNYSVSIFQDGIYHLSVITLVILDFCGVSQTVFKILSVFVVLNNYQQLLLYMRVFDITAVLISMIYYIVKDMIVFALIFIIAIIAFGNCFYIIQSLQEESSGQDPLAGGNFIMAFFYTYTGALGNFNNDGYPLLGQNQWILWVLYFFSSFLLSIILLNLLIAIMGDTYSSVMLLQKEERLRAKCRLIFENEFIFNRDRLFSNSRYIIVANIDKASNLKNDNWEGQMNGLINQFNTKIETEHEKSMENFKALRLNNQNLNDMLKAQESKLTEMTGCLSKISDQIKLIESRRRVKTIIKKSGNKIKEYFENQFMKSQQVKAQEDINRRDTEIQNPLLKLMKSTSKLAQQEQ